MIRKRRMSCYDCLNSQETELRKNLSRRISCYTLTPLVDSISLATSEDDGFQNCSTKHSGWIPEPRAARENDGHDLSREWRETFGAYQELRQVLSDFGNQHARATS